MLEKKHARPLTRPTQMTASAAAFLGPQKKEDTVDTPLRDYVRSVSAVPLGFRFWKVNKRWPT